MRLLMLCMAVINLMLALPREGGTGDCTLVLPTDSPEGVYQLWLVSDSGETLIRNNLTPDSNGILCVSGLPQPEPGVRYRFSMIGAGEGQPFDPAPKPAGILPF